MAIPQIRAANSRWLNQSGQLPQITPPQTPSATGMATTGQEALDPGINGGQHYLGGSANFDERTGQYRTQPVGVPPQAGLQAPAAAPATGVAPATAPASGGLPPGYSTQGGTLAGFSAPGVLAPFTQEHNLDPNQISQSPAYQFRMGQGLQAIDRSAAARGTLLTGGTLKDAMSFGQGLASTEYDNEWQRGFQQQGQNADIWGANANRAIGGLSSVANQGLNATGGQANALVGAGNAAAGGTRGGQSAINQGLETAGATLGDYFNRRRLQAPARQAGKAIANNPASIGSSGF